MTSEETERLKEELRARYCWFSNPQAAYISCLVRETKGEIPHYPEFIWAGGNSYTSSKKLYRLRTAIVMEDSVQSLYFPRQILLEDGRGMDCSSGQPFGDLLESVKSGSSLNVSSDV